MKRGWRSGAVAIAWWCCAAAVHAQAPEPSASAAARLRSRPPVYAAQAAASARQLAGPEREARRFLKDAWAASRFQVDAARIAASRSVDGDVKTLAASSRTTHARARDELLGLLHRRGLAAPMLENAQRRTLTHLARLKGAKLDHAYVQSVVTATGGELAQCERAAVQVDDAELRRWIDRMVPVLREQLRDAQRLAASRRDAEPAHPAHHVRAAHRPHTRHRGE
jgi:predicted outer membrane protein